jgi:hypothetical protein
LKSRRIPSPTPDSGANAAEWDDEELPEYDDTDGRLTRLTSISQAMILQAKLQVALNDAIDPRPE